MAYVTEDGSIIDRVGKVIFFSAQRFVDDICLGNCCFICGPDRHSAAAQGGPSGYQAAPARRQGGGKPRGHREGPPEGGKPREVKAPTDTGPVARSQGLACRAFRGRGENSPGDQKGLHP
jgi:hypothetical protein